MEHRLPFTEAIDLNPLTPVHARTRPARAGRPGRRHESAFGDCFHRIHATIKAIGVSNGHVHLYLSPTAAAAAAAAAAMNKILLISTALCFTDSRSSQQ